MYAACISLSAFDLLEKYNDPDNINSLSFFVQFFHYLFLFLKCSWITNEWLKKMYAVSDTMKNKFQNLHEIQY